MTYHLALEGSGFLKFYEFTQVATRKAASAKLMK